MPGYDGTGPRGMGAMTGAGRGFCSPIGGRAVRGVRSSLAPRFGRGGGYGYYERGWGFGRGPVGYGGVSAPAFGDVPSPETSMSAAEEREALRLQMRAIEDDLAQLRAQLGEREE